MAEKDGEFSKSQYDGDEGGFLKFVWNPATGEFCGRNAASWLKITLFYIVFYFLLAGFWTLMLLIFYQTLDYYKPTWTLDGSRIGTNPGLGFRPLPHPDNVDSTLIWFTHGSGREWGYWVEALETFVEPYQGGRQSGEFVRTCSFDIKYEEPHVCKFVLEDLGNVCTAANSFGYDVGHPCLIIKLNRIYGWEPQPYKDNTSFPKTMPQHLRQVYDPNYIYITCEGENPADEENIGPVKYYPEDGKIPTYYFPFTNLEGYLSPFVYVHFERPATGVLINVECKAWAANIHHDRNDRMGSVHFELLID